MEQPTSLSAHRSAWPQHSSITPPVNLLNDFWARLNAKCVWVWVCVRALARMSVATHMLSCAMWVYVWVSAWWLGRGLTHAALFAFGVDGSQNTDVSSDISSQISVSHGTRDKEAGCSYNWMSDCELQQSLFHTVLCCMCRSVIQLSVTHRQTGRAVMGDAVLIVGLPRVPWGRTPGAVGLLLGLLESTTESHLALWSINSNDLFYSVQPII